MPVQTQNQPSEQEAPKPFADPASNNIKIYLAQTQRKKRKKAAEQ